jgi:hypothetical protein
MSYHIVGADVLQRRQRAGRFRRCCPEDSNEVRRRNETSLQTLRFRVASGWIGHPYLSSAIAVSSGLEQSVTTSGSEHCTKWPTPALQTRIPSATRCWRIRAIFQVDAIKERSTSFRTEKPIKRLRCVALHVW